MEYPDSRGSWPFKGSQDPGAYRCIWGLGIKGLGFRVPAPNNSVLGYWAIVIIVQVLGKYMIIGYLDP